MRDHAYEMTAGRIDAEGSDWVRRPAAAQPLVTSARWGDQVDVPVGVLIGGIEGRALEIGVSDAVQVGRHCDRLIAGLRGGAVVGLEDDDLRTSVRLRGTFARPLPDRRLVRRGDPRALPLAAHREASGRCEWGSAVSGDEDLLR